MRFIPGSSSLVVEMVSCEPDSMILDLFEMQRTSALCVCSVFRAYSSLFMGTAVFFELSYFVLMVILF